MSETIFTPLNIALSIFLLYLIYAMIPPRQREPVALEEEEKPVFRQYTPKTLAPFNGKDNKKIYFAVNRKVFDVSAGANFYGPGGMYGNFAGRDASRGLAKMSFDEAMLTDINKKIDDLSDLTKGERADMADWEQRFLQKYPIVGELVENSDDISTVVSDAPPQ